MSVLITGGTGFIGAEIARQVMARGEREIHVLHRSGDFRRLPDISRQINFVRVDLGQWEEVLATVASTQPRVIYHLGAMLTGPGEADPPGAIQTNAMGTFHVLEAARLHGVAQVLFASSIGVYGAELPAGPIDDVTLQRPFTIYGITKLFGELLGLFYRRKYGLDFRGLRYPSIIGPGVKTASVVQYTSWVIEAAAAGKPFVISVAPETAVPIMNVKDGARAMIELGQAPAGAIKSVNYLVDGVKPTPSADQLAQAVQARIPGAQITFAPDPAFQPLLDQLLRPIDDSRAHMEWGWRAAFDLEAIIDDFLADLADHAERYE